MTLHYPKPSSKFVASTTLHHSEAEHEVCDFNDSSAPQTELEAPCGRGINMVKELSSSLLTSGCMLQP
ncbi:hypothetical protein DEO72_LG6g631 [Vigna unguiculata]|uniref:Uncharacterized protein n=1 Tax=Vigna unguiculata TaxID=3917 RepID=A0A4D6M593_VIGUN|nr:hypothetical protein DEO72_LG6g631 [Vigna unguiculata]